MKKIVVFGSLNMDLVIHTNYIPQAGETIDGYGFFTNTGGKGGNQAVAASKLGGDVKMIACVGNDSFGNEMLNALREYNLDLGNVVVRKDETTGIAVIICQDGDNRIILNAGTNYSIMPEEVEKLIDNAGGEGDIFVTQYECRRETVIHALEYAKSKGMYTIFNPAPAKEIPKYAYKTIDLLVVNQTECRFLTGVFPENEGSAIEAINILKAMGVKDAVITLGKHGSITASDDRVTIVPIVDVPVVDTTAAGDSYIGSLAVGLQKGKSLEDCMKEATAVSALTVTRKGAQQSIPDKEELKEFLRLKK
jgi:ribokinase